MEAPTCLPFQPLWHLCDPYKPHFEDPKFAFGMASIIDTATEQNKKTNTDPKDFLGSSSISEHMEIATCQGLAETIED